MGAVFLVEPQNGRWEWNTINDQRLCNGFKIEASSSVDLSQACDFLTHQSRVYDQPSMNGRYRGCICCRQRRCDSCNGPRFFPVAMARPTWAWAGQHGIIQEGIANLKCLEVPILVCALRGALSLKQNHSILEVIHPANHDKLNGSRPTLLPPK
ncbi:hypothetical protein SISNIDRAFT_188732 [Sistotremastrum niveocremeum HHB9708]|uniref:Uncharacterized protein n=1 Tax=Sistotremastrum niveocremeum HHB9708 TaxID=1314777 RepID=A0A164Z4G9_9AGAM|nr:hypothetical protein SISNIDRAFT_188732 [Sistotremastrum niveocremeum HHB9708]